MRTAGREVGEPGLARVLRPHPVDPLDRLVGHVVGEVVRLAVLPLRYADGGLVLGDHRVVLARFAAEEPPEVVEPPAVRPAIERPRWSLLRVRGQVPLAERRGRVAVLLQDPRERRTVLRHQRAVARVSARELADLSESDRVMVPPGEHRRSRWGAEGGDVEPVVLQPAVGHPGQARRLDGSSERARCSEACVVDEHEQHIRRALGRLWRSDEVPIRLRPDERPVRHPAEERSPDREPQAVWSVHCHLLCLGCWRPCLVGEQESDPELGSSGKL